MSEEGTVDDHAGVIPYRICTDADLVGYVEAEDVE